MAGVRRFQDLICYQLARELRRTVTRLIKTKPLATDFNLCDQMRRAARSATGNIAEGFKCRSNAEFARFLEVSARSLSEIEDRLIETRDSEILTEEQAAPAMRSSRNARQSRSHDSSPICAALTRAHLGDAPIEAPRAAAAPDAPTAPGT